MLNALSRYIEFLSTQRIDLHRMPLIRFNRCANRSKESPPFDNTLSIIRISQLIDQRLCCRTLVFIELRSIRGLLILHRVHHISTMLVCQQFFNDNYSSNSTTFILLCGELL